MFTKGQQKGQIIEKSWSERNIRSKQLPKERLKLERDK